MKYVDGDRFPWGSAYYYTVAVFEGITLSEKRSPHYYWIHRFSPMAYRVKFGTATIFPQRKS